MITKENVIKIGNDLLNNQGDFGLWIELISDFVNEKDASKRDKIIQVFPSLPQPTQVQLIRIALEHFCKKFNVCTLSKEDANTNWIINGEPQKTMKILYYF